MNRILLCLAVFGGAVVNGSFAGQPGEPAGDEAVIRKADEAYVQAFNKHDAKALADAWSPEAVYLNRVTGDEFVGRAAITEQFTAVFKAQPEIKLDLSVQSIQFISPNVAVEQGIAKTLAPKTEPEEIEYSAVFVRREGQWLLDRVTEKAKEATPSRYEQLKPLEWMIGRWVDKDDEVDIETECQWTKNRSFITRSFTIAAEGQSRCPACRSSAGIRLPRPSDHGRSTPTAALLKPPGPARMSAVSVSRYAAISRARSSSHHRRLRNRRQLICASLLRRPQHLVDGAHDPFPAAHFHAQLLPPGWREAVVAGLAIVLRSAPERGDPAAVFEAVQSGIERSVLYQ